MRRAGGIAFAALLTGCAVGVEAPVASPVAESTFDGRLLVLEELGPPVISSLELDSGVSNPWYSLPSEAFAYELTSHPDRGVAVPYTPPPVDDGAAFDRVWVASLDADTQEATRLACPDTQGVQCFFPEWSADGASLWFVESGTLQDDDTHALVRVDARSGQRTLVESMATEPALGPGVAAWIAVHPKDGSRSLRADRGKGPETLVEAGVFSDLGQPFVSADGTWVGFVALQPQVAGWGFVPTAHAHSDHAVAGDWWRIPVEGGAAEQITDLGVVFHDGDPSPDGRHLAVATSTGVSVIDLASGEATEVLTTRAARAVEWLE